jgi:hypothetical protein
MGILLFVVEDTFSIRERDLMILLPGVSDRLNAAAGASIELRRPDGSRLATTFKCQAVFGLKPGQAVPILIPLPRDQVPVGTEVWLSDVNGSVLSEKKWSRE